MKTNANVVSTIEPADAVQKGRYQQMYKKFPICSTLEQMKNSYFDDLGSLSLTNDYNRVPCQVIPDVPYTYPQMPNKTQGFTITIVYPHNVKIVTQSQAVDVHSLIGNIGGYVGLCLGYNFLQIPALITIVSRIFKKYFKSGEDTADIKSASKWHVATDRYIERI